MIERDSEVRVWAKSEDDARKFFGRPVLSIRVVKERPETALEQDKYDADAKLYAIKMK